MSSCELYFFKIISYDWHCSKFAKAKNIGYTVCTRVGKAEPLFHCHHSWTRTIQTPSKSTIDPEIYFFIFFLWAQQEQQFQTFWNKSSNVTRTFWISNWLEISLSTAPTVRSTRRHSKSEMNSAKVFSLCQCKNIAFSLHNMDYIKTKLSYILIRWAAKLNPKLITKCCFQKQIPEPTASDWNYLKQEEIESFSRRCVLRYLADYMENKITIVKTIWKRGQVDTARLEFAFINTQTK